ncbi:Os03g0244750 [Oryza sativa Japonica Group]|uniref:Os03g0244750 protein n=1 Tax=Oryza sativa subsp. japonica TaxID=39947 RepID=A0A0P0VVC4_ORYSJ|nr:hypothetical protein EE612_016449 [Oryza sativa]BAS83229.1 Os03g0244750 [Oryza sativa Japonica Group]
MRSSQATSSSAVSSMARVRGRPETGLSVKKRRRREWLWKHLAAIPAALLSARTVSAMMRAAGRSYSSARAACRSSAASFSARDRRSMHSARKHCHPACFATWSASWIGFASIAFTPSPILPPSVSLSFSRAKRGGVIDGRGGWVPNS